MLLNRFAALVKRGHLCRVIHVAGDGMWLAVGTALYRAVGVPTIQTDQEMRTVLSISPSAWDKIRFKVAKAEGPENVFGLDLTEFRQGDMDTRPMKLSVNYAGSWHSGLETKDGELVFFDPSLTGPVADVLAGEYGEIVVRTMAGGGRYLAVRDGMETVAVILPENVLNQDFLADLSDFTAACTAQLVHQREAPEDLEGEEA